MSTNSRSNWLQLSEQERRLIFEESSAVRGLPIMAIEKDWWVVQALSLIFTMDCAPALIFKGGTSLNKGYDLIQRFSEDIDLALDREFLGFKGELTKGDIRRLRKKSYQFITEIFTPQLKDKFAESGFYDIKINYRRVENHDQDPLIVEIHYPSLSVNNSYLKPAVWVEVGCRSLKEPITERSVTSIVSEVFPDMPFSDKSISVPIVNPERTFLEKIFLLHEEFQKSHDKIRVDRLSRHLYDIEKLMQTEYAKIAIQNTDLYYNIVNHRSKFTPISGIDYKNHSPNKIKIIPPENIIHEWERDYASMTQSMIYGSVLSFNDLIIQLTKLQQKLNEIEK